MATQFENGLTLSRLAERNAELITEVEKLRAERAVSLNAERVWEKTMMEVCGEDSPASVASEIRSLRALRDTAMQVLKAQVEQLAAENVGLKAAITDHSQSVHFCEVCGKDDPCSTDDVCYVLNETPATDRIVAGIKADAANQMCVAFVKHKELAGMSDDDLVTVREATDAVLHCAEVISEGAK